MTDTYDEFMKFHNSNPQVWAKFCEITKREIAKIQRSGGRMVISASSVMQEIRDDKRIKTTTLRTTGRKIDNNWNSYYARHFMTTYPEHGGVFRVRQIKTSEKAQTLFGEKPINQFSQKRSDHY